MTYFEFYNTKNGIQYNAVDVNFASACSQFGVKPQDCKVVYSFKYPATARED